jgi:hypothetical protein
MTAELLLLRRQLFRAPMVSAWKNTQIDGTKVQ